ncbi:3-hydroxyacyl-ACP dehydratase [Mucilaginibacter gotjawali]|nr:3-hydroxyacyl-ACP dehydratase [Mucilaginibacter gotjawali]
MIFPVDDILSLIPQQPPFVMVSKLLQADELNARSSFLICMDNVLVKNNTFQEAGLLENMAQTAALWAGYMAKEENRPVSVAYIGAIKNLEIYKLPIINDELITEITIENQIFGMTVFSGRVWHDKNLLAQCEMKVFISNKQDTM